jgi:hypothetical protein
LPSLVVAVGVGRPVQRRALGVTVTVRVVLVEAMPRRHIRVMVCATADASRV